MRHIAHDLKCCAAVHRLFRRERSHLAWCVYHHQRERCVPYSPSCCTCSTHSPSPNRDCTCGNDTLSTCLLGMVQPARVVRTVEHARHIHPSKTLKAFVGLRRP